LYRWRLHGAKIRYLADLRPWSLRVLAYPGVVLVRGLRRSVPGMGQGAAREAVPASSLSWPVGEGANRDRDTPPGGEASDGLRIGAIDGTVTRMSDTTADRAESAPPGRRLSPGFRIPVFGAPAAFRSERVWAEVG
jgi:hypothetical protein